MKTEYKKDLKNNYLVLEPEEEINSEDYDVRMMEQNQIPGFLPMQVRNLDGNSYLYYEITSMQRIDLACEKRQLCDDDIRHILSEVRGILEMAQKYLLKPERILFDPQYMYLSTEDEGISVCYLPVREKEFSILPLAEFLLKKLDHEDVEAVSLGYGFYQKVSGQNFSLSDALHEVLSGKQNTKNNPGRGRYQGESRDQGQYQDKNPYQGSGRSQYQDKNPYQGSGREPYPDPYQSLYRKQRQYQEQDPRAVTGRNLKKKEVESPGSKRWRLLILPLTVCLLSAVGILLYLGLLGFTEAGGLFFLILAAAVLADRFWKNKEKKKSRESGKYSRVQGWDWYEDDPEEEPKEDEWDREDEENKKDRWEKEEVRNGEDEWDREAGRDRAAGWDREAGRDRAAGWNRAAGRDRAAGWDDGGKGIREDQRRYGEVGPEDETQYLGEAKEIKGAVGMKLVSSRPEKYPQIQIGQGNLIVGKKKGQADFILEDAAVSRIHAKLEYQSGNYFVTDLDSRNGTYLNGVRLVPREQAKVREGDEIAFANISYTAIIEDGSDMTQLLR